MQFQKISYDRMHHETLDVAIREIIRCDDTCHTVHGHEQFVAKIMKKYGLMYNQLEDYSPGFWERQKRRQILCEDAAWFNGICIEVAKRITMPETDFLNIERLFLN